MSKRSRSTPRRFHMLLLSLFSFPLSSPARRGAQAALTAEINKETTRHCQAWLSNRLPGRGVAKQTQRSASSTAPSSGTNAWSHAYGTGGGERGQRGVPHENEVALIMEGDDLTAPELRRGGKQAGQHASQPRA